MFWKQPTAFIVHLCSYFKVQSRSCLSRQISLFHLGQTVNTDILVKFVNSFIFLCQVFRVLSPNFPPKNLQKNTGAQNTHALVFLNYYCYSVSNICWKRGNFPAKKLKNTGAQNTHAPNFLKRFFHSMYNKVNFQEISLLNKHCNMLFIFTMWSLFSINNTNMLILNFFILLIS